MKVALIDDEPDIREIVTLALEATGIEIVSTGDPSTALGLVREEHPDLVLLDRFLGQTDGENVLVRLKSDPGLADIPVVFLTGSDDPATRARLIEAGAAGIIAKPFDPLELGRQVFLYREERKVLPKADEPEVPIFDRSALDSLRSIATTRPGFIERLVSQFREDTGQRLERMRADLVDHALIEREAHAIKGSAGHLGLMRLSAAANELEHAARQRSARVGDLLERLSTAFREAADTLDDLAR